MPNVPLQIRAAAAQKANKINRPIFLSFETKDWNNAISNSLQGALDAQIPAIVSGHILKKLIGDGTSTEAAKKFRVQDWNLFTHARSGLYIIIPERLDVGINTLQSIYEFKAVTGPISKISLLARTDTPDVTTKTMIAGLKEIINTPEEYVRQFFWAGHGGEGSVANMKVEELGKFFEILADLKTRFLYISTCNASGQNLVEIQKKLQEIFAQKLEDTPKVNFTIAVEATSDVTTSGQPDFEVLRSFENIFDKKSNDYDVEEKIKIGIDLALPVSYGDSLPSIRPQGTRTFFRAINLGRMQIITWIYLQGLRLASSSRPFAKTPPTGEYIIPIHPTTEFIQIYPCNLKDCTFDIKATEVPKFISKIPGNAQHFIGGIKYASSKKDLTQAIEELVKNGFVEAFQSGIYKPLTNKCWFIKTIELLAGGVPYSIDHVAINLNKSEYIYHDNHGYHKTDGQVIDEATFKKTISDYFDQSQIDKDALYQATGGNESYKDVLDKVSEDWKEIGVINELIKIVNLGTETDLANYLKKTPGVDVNVQDKEGNTALILAVKQINPNKVALLLQKKPDLTIVTKNAMTVKEIAKLTPAKALKHDADKIVELLEKAEAEKK